MENLLRWDCLKEVFFSLISHTVPKSSVNIKMFEKRANSLQYVIPNRISQKGVSVTTDEKNCEDIFLPVHTMQTYKEGSRGISPLINLNTRST
jgi:hypothetical protein